MRVSARAGTSRQALAGLLAFWFATCLLAPRLGTDLAGFVHPAPLATAFDAAIEEDFAQMVPFPQRVEAVTKRLVSDYGVAGPEALPVSPIGFALSEGETESSHIYRRHLDALFDIYERQEQVGCSSTSVRRPPPVRTGRPSASRPPRSTSSGRAVSGSTCRRCRATASIC